MHTQGAMLRRAFVCLLCAASSASSALYASESDAVAAANALLGDDAAVKAFESHAADAFSAVFLAGWWDAADAFAAVCKAHHLAVCHQAVTRAVAQLNTRSNSVLDTVQVVDEEGTIPASEWAQSPTHIHLAVKFAPRLGAPAIVKVRDPSASIEADRLLFSVVGATRPPVLFRLDMVLFGLIDPSNSSWEMKGQGRATFSLAKRWPGARWPRVLRSKAAEKVFGQARPKKWWQMQERLGDGVDELPVAVEGTGEPQQKAKGDGGDKSAKKGKAVIPPGVWMHCGDGGDVGADLLLYNAAHAASDKASRVVTSMMSSFSGTGGCAAADTAGASAALAISAEEEGRLVTDGLKKNRCARTKPETEPWVQLDLGSDVAAAAVHAWLPSSASPSFAGAYLMLGSSQEFAASASLEEARSLSTVAILLSPESLQQGDTVARVNISLADTVVSAMQARSSGGVSNEVTDALILSNGTVLARYVRIQFLSTESPAADDKPVLQVLEVHEIEVAVKPPRGVKRPAKKKKPSRWAAHFVNGSALPAGFDSMPLPARLAVAMKVRGEERRAFLGSLATVKHLESLASVSLSIEKACNKSVDALEASRKRLKAAVDKSVDANITRLKKQAKVLEDDAMQDAADLKKSLFTAIREVEVHVQSCLAVKVDSVESLQSSLSDKEQQQLLTTLIESYKPNATALPFCDPEPVEVPEVTWTLSHIRQKLLDKGVTEDEGIVAVAAEGGSAASGSMWPSSWLN